jgi:hypothetical protein
LESITHASVSLSETSILTLATLLTAARATITQLEQAA